MFKGLSRVAVTLGSARPLFPFPFPRRSGNGNNGRYQRMPATEDVGKHAKHAMMLSMILYCNTYYMHIYFYIEHILFYVRENTKQFYYCQHIKNIRLSIRRAEISLTSPSSANNRRIPLWVRKMSAREVQPKGIAPLQTRRLLAR